MSTLVIIECITNRDHFISNYTLLPPPFLGSSTVYISNFICYCMCLFTVSFWEKNGNFFKLIPRAEALDFFVGVCVCMCRLHLRARISKCLHNFDQAFLDFRRFSNILAGQRNSSGRISNNLFPVLFGGFFVYFYFFWKLQRRSNNFLLTFELV